MMRKFWLVAAALVVASSFGFQALAAEEHDHDHGDVEALKHGVCVLAPASGSKVQGKLTLVQHEGSLHLTGEVSGLTPGLHGFHIHEFGDLSSADGTAAGPHFNPEGHEHGGPDQAHRHAGDLGNIKADDQGVAKVDVKVEGLHLHFVLGRSLVVHANPDDLKSQPAGNAGPRIGVGVIGVAKAPEAK